LPALSADVSASAASVALFARPLALESWKHQVVLELVHGVSLLVTIKSHDGETATRLVINGIFNSGHFNCHFVSVKSLDFIECVLDGESARAFVEGAHRCAVFMHFVSGQLACEV